MVAASAALQYTNYQFNARVGDGEVWAAEGRQRFAGRGHAVELTVYDKALSEGRFFTLTDEQRAANVTVLGHDVAAGAVWDDRSDWERGRDRRG